MEAKIQDLESQFSKEQAALVELSQREVEDLRVRWLGRKGLVTGLFEQLRDLPAEERPAAGKYCNAFREKIQGKLEQLLKEVASKAIDKRLEIEGVDVTLPVDKPSGSLHPVRNSARLRFFGL